MAAGWGAVCQVQVVVLVGENGNVGPCRLAASVNVITAGFAVRRTGLIPSAGFPCAIRTPFWAELNGRLEAQMIANLGQCRVKTLDDQISDPDLEFKEPELAPYVVGREVIVLEELSNVPAHGLGDRGEQFSAFSLMLREAVRRAAARGLLH